MSKWPNRKWAPNRPDLYVQTGSMFDNPHGVPRDEIIAYIAETPAEVVAQVVFGKYVESSGLVFSGELIQNLVDRTAERITANSFLDRAALTRARSLGYAYQDFGRWPYHTGVDFARQTDYTVITTIDTTTLPARVVYFRRLNRVPWETIYTEVGRAASMWGPNVLCDGTGPGGDVVMDELENRLYCPIHKKTVLATGAVCLGRRGEVLEHPERHHYLPLNVAEAFHFTGTTKKELVEHLRNVLSVGYDATTPDVGFGNLRCPPIVQLEEELTFYAWDDKKLVTDSVFSLALAAWSGLEDPIGEAALGSIYGD
jgi:hypothetical protein